MTCLFKNFWWRKTMHRKCHTFWNWNFGPLHFNRLRLPIEISLEFETSYHLSCLIHFYSKLGKMFFCCDRRLRVFKKKFMKRNCGCTMKWSIKNSIESFFFFKENEKLLFCYLRYSSEKYTKIKACSKVSSHCKSP